MKLTLSPDAARDIGEIDDFTTTRWGSGQAERYIRDIRTACDRLVQAPRLGRRKAGVPRPYLAYKIASHFIIFRMNDDEIEVLRILHQSMDISAHLAAGRRS